MANQAKHLPPNSLVGKMLQEAGYDNPLMKATKQMIGQTVNAIQAQLLIIPTHMHLFDPTFIRSIKDIDIAKIDKDLLVNEGRAINAEGRTARDNALELIRVMGEFLETVSQKAVSTKDSQAIEDDVASLIAEGVALHEKYQDWAASYNAEIIERLNNVVEMFNGCISTPENQLATKEAIQLDQ